MEVKKIKLSQGECQIMNMLSPKKTKFRKQFKGRIHGNAKGNFELNYGSYGLKAYGTWANNIKTNWISS